ncbi:MAG: asparaginase domain-containing protein [Treponemataceae bacterium]
MFKSHIALEVRVLLLTGVKAFCPCVRGTDGSVGSCPICRKEEGAKPHLNTAAARKAYAVARALGCTIIKTPRFERNLSTPELPPDYRLSCLSLKIGTDGILDISFHRRKKNIRIAEIRVEEDAGRLTHSGNQTRMDYSNVGMPSLRIRTEADFDIGEEAEVFLSDLRRKIQYLEIIPGVPVESVIRCNAHVAIVPYPETPIDFVKLRNLNSFNFVRKAVNAELGRQEDIIANGGKIVSESRIWNETKNSTESFQKRKAEDKNRFEELPAFEPFAPGPEVLEAMDAFIVELPGARRDRVAEKYGLTLREAEFICDEKSRADYFERAVAAGTSAREVFQWLASFIVKELKRTQQTIGNEALAPERLSALLAMMDDKRIHAGIAKQAIAAALESGKDPVEIVKEKGWEQLTDRTAIETIVRKIVAANPMEVRRVRDGDARPIRFLTGKIMKESNGLAEPTLVKEILREELSVSLVYILSMGGAISGRRAEDGAVEPGDERALRDLLSGSDLNAGIRFESIQVGRLLSEEITPSDWAALITAISDKLNSGTANGIVVAHGTDTLPYTAPLLYWLFADAGAPIVLAASSTPPGGSSEATDTIRQAIALASEKKTGVYVVHGGKVLSPLNLKFERIGYDGFRNWNMKEPVFTGSSLLTGLLEADQYVLAQLLEDAVNSMCVIRVYPGLRADYLTSLMDLGVRKFFLELYDTGTASFREGPYSLKRAFTIGRRKNAKFFCSSQQEGFVDFKGYSTSRELWREGAVPMGGLTTESAVARYLAASIIADSEEELESLMDGAETERAIDLPSR